MPKRELQPVWKVHTPCLLKEIGSMTGTGFGILKIPLSEFGKLLFAVGERAAELNDPKLNALMMRLTIYAVADPESPDYDRKTVSDTLAGQGWC